MMTNLAVYAKREGGHFVRTDAGDWTSEVVDMTASISSPPLQLRLVRHNREINGKTCVGLNAYDGDDLVYVFIADYGNGTLPVILPRED